MKLRDYTTPISITSQFFFCGLPLRLDTYRGCAFHCAFCFARRRGGNSPADTVLPANPRQISNIFDRALQATSAHDGLVAQFIRRRVPIHFGGMSDPFQPAEIRYRVTEATLTKLAACDYPTVISTRGTLVGAPEYVDLLRSMTAVAVQFSLSSSDDAVARRSEPRSHPPSELLNCMEKLTKCGIHVTCRWQPYIPGVSETPREFVARVASTGCAHISLEHLKVPLERNDPAWTVFCDAVGKDFYRMYRLSGATRDGREYVLPAATKLELILDAADEIRRAGMTFGAADNELQYFSDTTCCCSGVDQFPGFQNFFKHQISYAIRKCRGQRITYDAIRHEWAPDGSVDRFLNSRSRLARGTGFSSIRDHIKKRWNEMGAPGSPTSFLGIVKKGEQDGMNLYEWADSATSGELLSRVGGKIKTLRYLS